MEAYLSAAGKISRLAIGDVNAPRQWVWDVPADTAQNHHIEGLPFGTRGGILIKHQFPADGDYTFNVKGVTGYFKAVLGGITGERLEITIDGERVHLFDWDKEIANTTGVGRWTPKIPVKAGLHTVGVTFLADQRHSRHRVEPAVPADDEHAGTIPGFLFYPHVGQVTIEGPHDAKGASDTASRQKIFVCQPPKGATARQEERCAAHDRLHAGEARVPPSGDRRGHEGADAVLSGRPRRGGQFEDGIEAALQRILADRRVHLSRRARAGECGGRQAVPHHRSRAGVAALVLPLEQHSGRRADRRRRGRATARAGGARAAGAADARGSEVPRR